MHHAGHEAVGTHPRRSRHPLALQSAWAACAIRPASSGKSSASTISKWLEPMAEALKSLGSTHAWIVHGADGMDELTTTGSSTVAELHKGDITVFEVTPEDAGLKRATLADLKGGDPQTNAAKLRALLLGETGPLSRHRSLQYRRSAHRRRQSRWPRNGRRARGRNPSTAARRAWLSISLLRSRTRLRDRPGHAPFRVKSVVPRLPAPQFTGRRLPAGRVDANALPMIR